MKICLRLFARKSGIALLFAGNHVAERSDAQVFFHEDFNDLELGQLTTTPFLPHVFRPNSFFTDFPLKANS